MPLTSCARPGAVVMLVLALLALLTSCGTPARRSPDSTIVAVATTTQIAREAGIRVIPNLYSDTLGEPGGEADTYIKMMRYNATVITEGLQP